MNLRLHGQEIITGKGSIEFLKELKYEKYFIVTGKSSMFKNGTVDKIKSILKENNSECLVFSGVSANPTTDVVLKGVEEMNRFKPDAVIGVGGGSSIDASKVMTLLYEHPELAMDSIRNSIDMRMTRKTGLIAIPSTSGTATEVTKTAVITFPEDDIKIGLKTYSFIPDYAILDGEITLSMPKHVVAETGMDAMTHAVECYTNKKLDNFGEVLCRGAVEGLYKYLPLSYERGDIDSRQKVHDYQCVAGMAFHNIGLGMDHGISHAFGGMFNYGHGLLNAVGLPYVLTYNRRDPMVKDRLNKLADAVGEGDFIGGIVKLNEALGIPFSFREMGIDEREFEENYGVLLDNAMLGSTRANPVKMTKGEMDKVLRAIYYGDMDSLK